MQRRAPATEVAPAPAVAPPVEHHAPPTPQELASAGSWFRSPTLDAASRAASSSTLRHSHAMPAASDAALQQDGEAADLVGGIGILNELAQPVFSEARMGRGGGGYGLVVGGTQIAGAIRAGRHATSHEGRLQAMLAGANGAATAASGVAGLAGREGAGRALNGVGSVLELGQAYRNLTTQAVQGDDQVAAEIQGLHQVLHGGLGLAGTVLGNSTAGLVAQLGQAGVSTAIAATQRADRVSVQNQDYLVERADRHGNPVTTAVSASYDAASSGMAFERRLHEAGLPEWAASAGGFAEAGRAGAENLVYSLLSDTFGRPR